MLVLLQLEMVVAAPLKVTVPALGPKLLPEIVTWVPGAPPVGLTLLMEGAFTVKATPLLATLLTVTTTLLLPAAKPPGTTAVMLVALQEFTAAAVPPTVTLLDPCVEPKFVPVIVTDAPSGPDVGDKLL